MTEEEEKKLRDQIHNLEFELQAARALYRKREKERDEALAKAEKLIAEKP